MDRMQFEDLLDLYGSDLDCWPDIERQAGQSLVERDPEVKASLQKARAIDFLIVEALEVEPAPYGLATRITAQIADKERLPKWLSGLRLVLGGGAISTAASVLGFFAMSAFLGASEGGFGDLLDVANGSYMTALVAL